MARLLFCLPICLLLAPAYPDPGPLPANNDPPPASTKDAQTFPEELGGDPIVFLKKCLERYDREIKGYTLTLRKREKVEGKLKDTEVLDVAFKDRPHSVFFHWKQGSAGLAAPKSVLYVEGENDNRLKVQLTFLMLDLPLSDDRVIKTSRYPITEFGFRKSTQRVYDAWKRARAEGALHVAYLGVEQRPETGDRPCHVIRRSGYARAEEGDIMGVTFYFDRETWLQVGAVLFDGEGKLAGEYFFRDVRLNPKFAPGQFTPAALKKK